MNTLCTKAEQQADKVRELPSFRNFSLPGIKDKIAIMLGMIGKVETIFSTYTLHDISHVESMLNMLDWLIPPSTQEAMTPVDWLMIVLAIYLHDLGMVVSSEEYAKRNENRVFCQFLEELQKRPEDKDYLARAERLTPEIRERFFYQEFIRKAHASRIKEWITGRHSIQWGNSIRPIADTVAEMLNPLPIRFREHLALICESHHLDNSLDNTELFPLFQPYGSRTEEAANVQYAALILRTADLLHVTWDRTPSVMYKIIGLSDPMSIDEWEKQKEVFSVNRKSRDFDPNDTDTHVILISANFMEERPYFALSEYLVYADKQIKQTKLLADASQKRRDGKHYSFPWLTIKGDIWMGGDKPTPMRFELDRGRLLDLLVGHTIYNEPTVAVRELLQNAIDAVRYQYHAQRKEALAVGLPEPVMGEVKIYWNPETYQLIIEDNGIGMDEYIIKEHLMSVGSSFYNTSKFQHENSDFTPISRFGIGILTCFMVSDDIEIVTCCKGGGYRIRMTSVQGDYLLKELEHGNAKLSGLEPHGTRVTLQFRSNVDFKGKDMLSIIRYWIILPACKVSYNEPGKEIQGVGFNKSEDALYYSHIESVPDKLDDDFEILKSVFKANSETYELCFIVKKSFTPEHNFLNRRNSEAPAVCIEGIRVDNRLPGFGYGLRNALDSSRGICAMLTVSGNKRFRTTVSRSDLEVDEEYLRVAEICACLLFKHVENEVIRLSESDGTPLSRASTAGQWIYATLDRDVVSRKIENFLKQLYTKLPLVVLEKMAHTTTPNKFSRDLISLEELANIEVFWTIESRLTDYLSDISRDLGKELSLNYFLATIAPEQLNLQITPIVSDPQQFTREILSTFKVK